MESRSTGDGVCMRLLFFDDQGGGVMNLVDGDVSPSILLNAAKGHALLVVSVEVSR